MNIGIDARFYGSLGKGLGRYTEKLLSYLEADATDEHTYVVFLRRENFDEYQPKHAHFKKIIADYPWYGWQEQLLFPLLLWRHQLNLVHFPHFNVPLFVPVPFIVTLHDLILLRFPTVKASELPPFLYWLKYIAYRVVIAMAVRRSRAIIAVSEFTRHDIERAYPAARGKISVTLEAAEPFCSWLSPAAEHSLLESLGLIHSGGPGSAPERLAFVLYVGNAYPHKNLTLLLKVSAAFPEQLFLCVGKDDFFYRAFREQTRMAGATNIRFAGYVSDASLGVLYRRARAYLFPSLYEGFGLPGLEAMLYGTPVVAAAAGSLPEIYGPAATYFNPTSVSECIQALRAVLQQSVSHSQRAAGFSQVAKFSWRRMARETQHLYESCPTKRY